MTDYPNATVITLIQPWISFHDKDCLESDRWDPDGMEALLADTEESSLAVFPEGFPWGLGPAERTDEELWPVEFAREKLRAVARRRGTDLIAGGYFREHGVIRNMVLLARHDREEVAGYRKRILWHDRERARVAAANVHEGVVFQTAAGPIIPLICADVFGATVSEAKSPSPAQRTIVESTSALVRSNPGARVLVCSYAKSPFGDLWTRRLRQLAREVGTDALYCNFAGDDGTGFGGGGSGRISPDGSLDRAEDRRAFYRYSIA